MAETTPSTSNQELIHTFFGGHPDEIERLTDYPNTREVVSRLALKKLMRAWMATHSAAELMMLAEQVASE